MKVAVMKIAVIGGFVVSLSGRFGYGMLGWGLG